MNLLRNKMFQRLVRIGLFPYILTLLLVLFGGILTFFNFDIFTAYHEILQIIYPITMIFIVFLAYRFLYDRRFNSLYAQARLTKHQKIVLPLLLILIPALAFDAYNINSGVDPFNYFYFIYLKYLIFSFTILFIVSSSTALKTTALLLLSALAIIVNESLFSSLQNDLLSLVIVLVLVIVPLIVSYKLYYYQKRVRNSQFMDRLYYFLIFIIVLVFFRELFITNYPYYINGLTITILSSSINVTFYLLAFLSISVFIYLVEHKLAIKKILSLSLIAILLSVIYVGISNYLILNSSTCQEESFQKRNNNFTFMDHYGVRINDLENMKQMESLLKSKADRCFDIKNVSAGLDIDALVSNNEVAITFNNQGYLIERDNINYSELVKIIINDKKIFGYSIKNETVIYSAETITLKDKKLIEESYGFNNITYQKISEEEIAFLFNQYLLYLETMNEDVMDIIYNDVELIEFFILDYANVDFDSSFFRIESFDHKLIDDFNKVREGVNHD